MQLKLEGAGLVWIYRKGLETVLLVHVVLMIALAEREGEKEKEVVMEGDSSKRRKLTEKFKWD